MFELNLMTGLHILAAGVFVGSNILLERVIKRLDALPPREAARLGELLGTDIVYINFGALIVLGAAGIYRIFISNMTNLFITTGFYQSSYGITFLFMIFVWITLVISSCIITFYFRPRLMVKLPFDTGRDALEPFGEKAFAASKWMIWLGRYNLVAAVVAILVSATLRYGGLW
jgi:uncharacterized membrane protein